MVFYRLAPLRKARVVARRWFKIERIYTDNNGHFQFTKHFKHKVRINVKFKNDDAVVRCLRGVRVWNTFSPLNKVIGVYSGDKSNITYNFAQYTDKRAKGNQYWVGGTVHNALQEYKDYAPAQGIGLPPGNLSILITNWTTTGDGATPMLEKLSSDNFPSPAITYYVANTPSAIAGGVPVLQTVIGHNIDVIIGYSLDPNLGTSFFSFKSDHLKETTYHELTHAAHYAKLGSAWYTQFLNSEVTAIINNIGSGSSPYGNGGASYSSIIALGESWAYYMGHFMADLRYGVSYSSKANEQGIDYNNNYIPGLSCHLIALENYDPYLINYPFDWIPKGIYYDMIDNRNDATAIPRYVNLTDQVSGYTNQQMFNAFSSGITTLQGYKSNLLSQNNNNQSTQVISLFSQYGY